MKLLIKNGTIIDPDNDLNEILDILVEDGRIVQVARDVECSVDQIIDADGFYVLPGFVDLHVHFREPGYTHKETIKTGSKAAAHGGYTSVFCMPNTNPPIDTVERLQELNEIIERDSCVHVYPVGAITCGQSGQKLSDIKGMKKAGILALSEDGKSVMNAKLYREALYKAKELGIPIFAHCEEIDLVDGGVMNAGKRAQELGLRGISNSVEDIITSRDVLLAKETGATLHLCHLSTMDAAKILQIAREDGVEVTAEVCPHHFILSEEDIPQDDSNYKMNPPLRSSEDVQYLKNELFEGRIDIIATDHAPHSEEEKAKSMETAPFGIVGIETAFALSYTELVEKGRLSFSQLVRYMSTNPAKVVGIPGGNLSVGGNADLTIVDVNEWYQIDKTSFQSMGKNTPFHGKKVKGSIRYTIVNGSIVYHK